MGSGSSGNCHSVYSVSFKRHLKVHLLQQQSALLLAGRLSTVRPAPV